MEPDFNRQLQELMVNFEFDENTQSGRDFAGKFIDWIEQEYGKVPSAQLWVVEARQMLNSLPPLEEAK